MNTRIKAVRKTLGLTLDKFGERLGISNSACSALETGKNKPSEQTIRAICREFGVNEIWLTAPNGRCLKKSIPTCLPRQKKRNPNRDDSGSFFGGFAM